MLHRLKFCRCKAIILMAYIIYFLSFITHVVWAGDKTIVITKEADNMPNIQVVSVDGNDNTMKIYKMLVQDLRTTGHFNVYYDDTLRTNILKNNLQLQMQSQRKIAVILK